VAPPMVKKVNTTAQEFFLAYLDDWEKSVRPRPGLSPAE